MLKEMKEALGFLRRCLGRWLIDARIPREPDLQVVVNGVRFWSLETAQDEADWLEQHGRVPNVYLVRREADGSYSRVA